jgi:hypothetical protein
LVKHPLNHQAPLEITSASDFADKTSAYWTWNWWQILVVAGGGALILIALAWCLWYRYRVVPRLIEEARREAYAARALSASTSPIDHALAMSNPPAPLDAIPLHERV